MKTWPEKGNVRFDELIGPVLDAVKQLYDFRLKADHASYEGYDYTNDLAHVLPQPDVQLSREGIGHDVERGREPIQTLLQIAFHLGYIQGIRVEKKNSEVYRKLLRESAE